jgi:hypothetical protein
MDLLHAETRILSNLFQGIHKYFQALRILAFVSLYFLMFLLPKFKSSSILSNQVTYHHFHTIYHNRAVVHHDQVHISNIFSQLLGLSSSSINQTVLG